MSRAALILAWLLVGSLAWAGPDPRALERQLREDNRYVLASNPAGAAKKLELMASSPFVYFRGTDARFYDLLKGSDQLLPRVICNGDAHPLNYGPVKLRGHLVWGPNDQDEAHRAPFSWDVKRDATGLVLAARGQGLSPQKQKKVVKAYVRAYLDELERLDRGGSPSDPPRIVEQRLARAAAKSNRSWLGELLDPRSGEFRPGDKIVPLPGRAAEFQSVFDRFLRSLPPRTAKTLSRFRVQAVGEKQGSGVGSMGMQRYILALRDPQRGARVVIQLKEEISSSLARFTGGKAAAAASGGERVAQARRTELGGGERLDGWVNLGGRSYWVKELGPYQSPLDLSEFGVKDLRQLARANGAVRALAHSRSRLGAGRDPAARSILKAVEGKHFVREVAGQAHQLANEMTAQYRTFRRLHAAGAFAPR